MYQHGAQSVQKYCSTNEELPASGGTTTWDCVLAVFFVLGFIGNIIYIVYADLTKETGENAKESKCWIQPWYGVDYGDGEI